MIILGPKTAILGPQFCRILVLGPHFWWSGGPGLGPSPGSAPVIIITIIFFGYLHSERIFWRLIDQLCVLNTQLTLCIVKLKNRTDIEL